MKAPLKRGLCAPGAAKIHSALRASPQTAGYTGGMNTISWARYIYLAGVVVAVLLFAPMAWFPLIAVKVAIAAVLFLVSAVLWGAAALRPASAEERHPMPGAAWLFALLPLSYLLSYAFSIDRATGIIGQGLSTDTLLFVTLCAAAGMLGAALFRSAHAAGQFVRVLFLTLAAAALFQAVVLIFGLPGPFSDRTVNLVGKWNDFGVTTLILSLLLLIDSEFGGLTRRWRIAAWVAGVVALGLLALVNFLTVWALLLAVAIVIGLVSWAKSRPSAVDRQRARRMPWVPAVVAVVAAVFFFFGAAINTQLSTIIPVASLEVRPALQSTFDVITASHGASVRDTAIGMGPNTFGLMWLAHKPAVVNQSQFWNLDFTSGFSTLMTAFGTVGLLGAALWLVPAVLVLFLLWRGRGLSEGRVLTWSLGGAALLLWAAVVLYVPSSNLVLLAFACAGAVVGRLAGSARGFRLAMPLTVLVLVLALVWTGFASGRRAIAEAYVGQGALALQASNLDAAEAYTNTSLTVETMPENLRLAVAVGGMQVEQLAAQPASSSTQAALASTLQQTITAGQQAIALDPQDYRSYLALGQVYDLLAANKVEGAFDNAKAAYQAAATYSPLNPSIPLLLARLEATGGTVKGLQDALRQSLTLKPDYTDAILFLAQVDIARNDLASAINDTKVAAQTAPGVPSIWLQLGLLYYANKDTKDAIAPLEQAIQIQPDYANAQYYLGLSYAAQNRTQDAIALFQRLAQTNPDSADVKSILSNLEAGKPPIEAAPNDAAGKK